MRACFVAEEHGKLPQFARAVFRAYWGDERDISQEAELAKVVDEVGLPREELFAKIATPDYKDRLRANTDELIARGGFGSPTMFVDGDDMYFGNDRLELVAAALRIAGRGCV
jgi:2-hydroxychromene-2-carboxylate isomerase